MQQIRGPHYSADLRMQGVAIDLLRIMIWQRVGRGPKPKTDRWPWSAKHGETEVFGTAAPIDSVRDYLVAKNGRAPGR